MNMWCDRTVSREPVRYTAATMEMMRLEDLHHIKCSVNYAQDHSHGTFSTSTRRSSAGRLVPLLTRTEFIGIALQRDFYNKPHRCYRALSWVMCMCAAGHLANAVSTTYFAAKEWAKKDQAKAERLEKQWEKDPKGQRQKLLRRAEKNLLPPYAWSGPEFFGHKETSCFAFVNRRGKHKAELTGSAAGGGGKNKFFNEHDEVELIQ